VSLTLIDQVLGEFTLGVQRIGGDVFVLEIDTVEQRDGHADLVGLF
jgi:hypothetical protein